MVVSKRFWIMMLMAAVFIVAVTPAFAENDAQNCKSYSDYLAEYGGSGGFCWTCRVFMLFFDTGNEVSGYIARVIQEPARNLLAVGFGIWLLCHTAMFLSNIGDAPDLFAHLTNIGGGMIRAGIAAGLLLGGSAAAFDYFVNPILSSAAAYATAVVSDIPCSAGTTNSGSLQLPLGPGVRDSMECMIKQIANGMAPTQALAAGMRCGAWHYYKVPVAGMDLFWPPMWMWGCLMSLFFWVVSFLFPMALLDVVFRICIILGMLPLFVVAWVFPLTRSYASKGWDIFLGSCFVFVIASMMIGMLVTVVDSAWAIASKGNIPAFRAAMEAGQYVDAYKDLEKNGGVENFAIILAIAFFGIYIAPKVDEYASKFTDAVSTPSCALRAVMAIANAIVDLICLIITIFTMGAGACVYVMKIAQQAKRTAEQIKRVQERIKKIREMQRRARAVRAKMQKAKNYLH